MDPLQNQEEPDWLEQYEKPAEKPTVSVEEGFFSTAERQERAGKPEAKPWKQKKGLFDDDSDDDFLIPASVKEAKKKEEQLRQKKLAEEEARRRKAKMAREAESGSVGVKGKKQDQHSLLGVRPGEAPPSPAKPVAPAPKAPSVAKPKPKPKPAPIPEPEPEPEVDLFVSNAKGKSTTAARTIDTSIFAESQSRRPQTKKSGFLTYGDIEESAEDESDLFQKEHVLDDVFIPKVEKSALAHTSLFGGDGETKGKQSHSLASGGDDRKLLEKEGEKEQDLGTFEVSSRERELDAELGQKLKLAEAKTATSSSASASANVDFNVSALSSYIQREQAAAANSGGLFDSDSEDGLF